MGAGDVFLWGGERHLRDAEETSREYLTEAFRKEAKPSNGAVVVIVRPHSDDSNSPDVVGLAVAGLAAGVAQGTVRVRLDSWVATTPLPYSEIESKIHDVMGKKSFSLAVPSEMHAVKLGKKTGAVLLQVIREMNGGLANWPGSPQLTGRKRLPGEAELIAEGQDALALSAALAGIDMSQRSLLVELDGQKTLLQKIAANAHTLDLEDDLVAEELSRFDGEALAEKLSASVAAFEDADGKLVVFNVNKKSVEVQLGVDLIYLDVDREIFTLIQYKRLEEIKESDGSKEWIYRKSSEIAKQLDLMPPNVTRASSGRDWRMTQTPFWFKFVRSDAAKKQDGKLLKGMYVPADYLRLAMADGTLMSGPQGGFRVGYSNTRYVTKATFIEIMRKGFTGTFGEQSALMKELVENLADLDRSVMVAIRTRWADMPNEQEEDLDVDDSRS